MRKTLLALLMLVVTGAAVWFAMDWRGPEPATEAAQEDRERNDFEAEGVVLRQLDAEGRLQYEIEAERIVQLRNQGGLIASRLTLRHDPPDSEPGSTQQWVLTADEATLPADSRIVTLTGNVRARSTPQGSRDALQLEAAELSYDMEKQEVYTDGEVHFTSGGISVRGRGLRVNITDGTVRLESGTDATISL